jgi:Flp pilus assembly protein TadG
MQREHRPICLPAHPPARRGAGARARRRGVVVLEFIIAFPIVFIVTLASFEYAFLALVEQVATTAAVEAARQGAQLFPPAFPFDDNSPSDTDPDDNDDVADRIALVAEQFLAVHSLLVEPAAQGGKVLVVIDRREGSADTERAFRGNASVAAVLPPLTPALLDPNQVRVTVCFPLVDASDPDGLGGPVPDWLAPVGFSLAGRTLQVSAMADLE